MSRYSPEDRLTIARRVAEMLALPHMICRRRRCRRNGRCWYHFAASKEPCCLNNLNASQYAIFEELRESSQLIVITHQKRTMEAADALYGVTMQGDGISQVISQKIERSA